MRKGIFLLRRFKFLDATDRAILYTCMRIHAYAWTSGRDESKFDGRCYNLRENLVEIVRESSRGTLDLRFAGYRCRTSKEERSSRSLAEAVRGANDVLSLPPSLPLSLSLSLSFLSVHLSSPISTPLLFLAVSASCQPRHENVVRPRLWLRWPSVELKRGMPRMQKHRHKDERVRRRTENPRSTKHRWPNSEKRIPAR